MKKNRNQARDIGFYVLILVILLATVFTMTSKKNVSPELLYSEVYDLFENEQVDSFDLVGNELTMKLKTPYKDVDLITTKVYSLELFYSDLGDIIKEQKADGTIKEYDYNEPWVAPWWVSMLPYFGIILVFGLFWYFMMKNAARGGGAGGGAMKFGKARVRLGTDEKKKVTFADVAGADEEKAELQEIVQFLKNPSLFGEMGARIPKGVLLVGPPGTGKTLIAKAVAGEAGVQFLSISGSDFVELYVGVGASRVRDLFEQAKKTAPAIIFIDEIDAVGRQRGSGLGGGHDEREQTLNQLLVEMDGFGNNDGVIVIAATNRQDILDSALLRPGRFDRTVYVGLPDIRGREEILKVHSKGKPLGEDVDLNSIAKGTPGFTGADLENLLNESALLAVRRNRRFVTMADVDEAILKVMAGPEKRSRVISEKERKLTAYHEAGHAVVSKYLEHTDPVHHITIIPRGGAGGMTIYRPTEDKTFVSKSELFEEIVTCLGGRISEKLMLDDISTGASSDIQRASALARAMITKYGFSEKLGPISFDSSDHSIFIGRDFGQTKSYSEKIASEIDDEVKSIFDDACAVCEKILSEHRDQVIATAEYLLAHETMEGADFIFLCENGYVPEKLDEAEPEDIYITAAEEAAATITEIKADEATDNGEADTEDKAASAIDGDKNANSNDTAKNPDGEDK
ncbi:MAG: ATP-dependent zinc metalloprotease FtsH [Oscillospiraceae bacterium]